MIFSTIVLIRLWAILNHTFLCVLSSKFYLKIFDNRTHACWMRSANAASALCGCLPLHWFFPIKIVRSKQKSQINCFPPFFSKWRPSKKFPAKKNHRRRKKMSVTGNRRKLLRHAGSLPGVSAWSRLRDLMDWWFIVHSTEEEFALLIQWTHVRVPFL